MREENGQERRKKNHCYLRERKLFSPQTLFWNPGATLNWLRLILLWLFYLEKHVAVIDYELRLREKKKKKHSSIKKKTLLPNKISRGQVIEIRNKRASKLGTAEDYNNTRRTHWTLHVSRFWEEQLTLAGCSNFGVNTGRTSQWLLSWELV